MKQYIDKSVVVAEIKRRINNNNENAASYSSGSEHDYLYRIEENAYKDLISFLNTFEVKGVDLEKEIEEVKHNYKVDDNRHTSICSADIEWIAEHFFELGLKAAQKGE